MALSAVFLIFFLFQHFAINLTSVFSEDTFNKVSHFMGNNPLVQFLLQPVLMFGVTFHFVMGFVLEIKNKKAKGSKYAMNKGSANSTWMSRNMLVSGMIILIFLCLHFYDFWIPEMNYKYIQFKTPDENRYYEELLHKFHDPVRVSIYTLSFILLSLHLWHGFQSAFQSAGAGGSKYKPFIKNVGKMYAIVIPFGFVFIALYHHFINSH